MSEIKEYGATTKGMRFVDKLSFNWGVFMFASFAYIMGRWPDDFFYTYYAFLIPTMFTIRWLEFKP